MIDPEELRSFKASHPGYCVLCYVNSTAEIKALSDICCTSSNAVTIARQIPQAQGIIFVPDKHLGSWIQEKTGHTMALWEGFCPTHARIEPAMVTAAKNRHPGAKVLMHPEAPKESRHLADEILSTGGMCAFVKTDPCTEYIIATEIGIMHTLKKQSPKKRFYILDNSITCPNMRKGSVQAVYDALDGTGGTTVTVEKQIADRALGALQKMLDMSRQ